MKESKTSKRIDSRNTSRVKGVCEAVFARRAAEEN